VEGILTTLVERSIQHVHDESLDDEAKWGPVQIRASEICNEYGPYACTLPYGKIERSMFEAYVFKKYGDQWGMIWAPQGRRLHATGIYKYPLLREPYIPADIPDGKIILRFTARRFHHPTWSGVVLDPVQMAYVAVFPIASFGVGMWFNVHYEKTDGTEAWLWWEDPDYYGLPNCLVLEAFCSRWIYTAYTVWEQKVFTWVADASTWDRDFHYSDTFATLPFGEWKCFEYDVGKALRYMAMWLDRMWYTWDVPKLTPQYFPFTLEEGAWYIMLDPARSWDIDFKRTLGFKLYTVAPTIEAVCCDYFGQIGDIQILDLRGLSRPDVETEYPPDV